MVKLMTIWISGSAKSSLTVTAFGILNSAAFASASGIFRSAQAAISRMLKTRQPLTYAPKILPQPIMPILTFGAASVFAICEFIPCQIGVTFLNGVNHVCRAAVQFNDQPLCMAMGEHFRNIHRTVANRNHRRFNRAWPVFDMQQRRPRANLLN